ncbi:MAG: ATP synthase subunit I [Candidatus Aminicenantes bacterium]|nr:ATP synthase subunit I [Candidatus Aminicenantes bacterium]
MTSENSNPVARPPSPSPSAGSTDGPPVRSFEETAVRRIPVEIIALSAVVAVALLLIFDLSTGIFFFAGGILSTVSFLWMKNTLAGILNRKKAEAVRSGLIFYALRFVLILGVFLLIILAYQDRILAFAAGFSMAVPAFIIEAAKAFALMKTWKD